MSLANALLVIFLLYIFAIISLRAFLEGAIMYQLNRSAYKKREKGKNFNEWLFYSRYKEEIPKILRILYYTVLLIHPVFIIACVLLYIMKLPLNLYRELVTFIIIFDFVWYMLIQVLFWHPRGTYIPYERWITKKRGQKKQKKK